MPDPQLCSLSTIIVVDDEATFRQSLAEMLKDDGHQVLEFPSATAVPALDTLPRGALLVTDFEMPGANGVELADAFRRAHPNGHAILMSAYTIDGAVVGRPWLRFMPKPVDYETLHQLIHEQLLI